MTDPHQGSASAAPAVEPRCIVPDCWHPRWMHDEDDGHCQTPGCLCRKFVADAPRSEPGGPVTAAGQRLYTDIHLSHPDGEDCLRFRDAILAIEREAAQTALSEAISMGELAVTGEAADRAAPAEPANVEKLAWALWDDDDHSLGEVAAYWPEARRLAAIYDAIQGPPPGRAAPRSVEAGLEARVMAQAIANVSDSDEFGYDNDHAAAALIREYRRLSAAEGTETP